MEKLLSAQHIADHLGMHVKTLYKLLRDNQIALNFIRIHDRMIAFRPSDVESYLQDRVVIRTGDSPKRPRKQPQKKLNRLSRMFRIATNAEAQAFFAGLPKDADGNIIAATGIDKNGNLLDGDGDPIITGRT